MRDQFHKRDLRTLLGLAFSFACLLILLSMMGCAPEVKERQYGQVRTDFGPLQSDADLGLGSITQKGVNHSLLEWSGEIDSARLFRASETLITLGEIKGSKALVNAGRKLGRSIYGADGTATRTSFANSLYVSAIVGETKTDSLAKIEENDRMLADQITLLTKIAADVGTGFPWPKRGASAREIFDAVEAFIDAFLAATEKVVEPQIQDAMVKALNKKFYPIIRDVRLETESIFQEPRSLDIIRRFRDLAKRNELELGPESEKQLTDAEELMTKIEGIQKPQHVLTVLVMIWKRMDDAEREKVFKPVSEDLYDYLKGKSEKDLNCIANPDCKRIFSWLAKELAIKPAIEKQGVENIRQQISVEARKSLIEEIQAGVADVAPQIPLEVSKRIVIEITDIRTKLAGLRGDYGAFVRRVADGYARRDLLNDAGQPGTIVGFESSRIRVGIGRNRLNVSGIDETSSVATGAETIGTSMALASALWRHEPQSSLFYKRSVLSQVNKLLALGGFQSESGKPFSSLSFAVDPTAKTRRLYIREFAASPTGYVVPDALRVSSDGSTSYDSKFVDASVRGQAELLRGLSALIRSFRDWEKSGFDEALGKVSLGELITELPAEGLTQKLFPKDTFFALSVGNAGALLQNMTKKLSPVFLVAAKKNKVVWSNDLESNEGGDPTTIAGVVDIVDGKRADSVRTKNVARFLLAVAEFLEATEGIERTKADVLLAKNKEGVSSVDQLVEAREDIKLLALGLANFLSNQVQQKDGGFAASYNQAKIGAQASEPRTLIDQSLGVLALARVGDALDKDLYRWAAMDGLAFMNRVMWNSKIGFYRSVEGTNNAPSFDEVTASLLAGERIRLFLNEKSRQQWDRIAGPWYTAFQEL